MLNFNKLFQFKSADSNIFSLGLLFFFVLTKGGSPLDIHTTFFKSEIHHKVKIDLKLLEALTKDTDTILFIDLVKKMIQEIPDQRETCEDLIEHAALKSNEERFEIVERLAGKCFDGYNGTNKYLVKLMDKKEVHMEGSLAEDSAEWKEFLTEVVKNPRLRPNIKICSGLLKIIVGGVIKSSYNQFL